MNSETELRYEIDQVKAANPLRNMAEADGVKLRRTGDNHKGCCPFHEEKTPSFTIYGNNRFHCFGCGESGDVINYVRLRDGIDFAGAMTKLGATGYDAKSAPAQRVSFEPIDQPETPAEQKPKPLPSIERISSAAAEHLAKTRGFDTNVVELLAEHGYIGHAPYFKGYSNVWAMWEPGGDVVGLRHLCGSGWDEIGGAKNWLKIRRPGDSHKIVGARLLAESDHAVIVEGAPDFIAMAELIIEAGFGLDATPVMMWGANSKITPEDAERFRGKRCIIASDPGAAGDAAASRWAASLMAAGVTPTRWRHGDGDVNEALVNDKSGAVASVRKQLSTA